MMKYFVWIEGLRGPEPQIWYDDDQKDGVGKSKKVLAKHDITDADLSMSHLALLYPAPTEAKT